MRSKSQNEMKFIAESLEAFSSCYALLEIIFYDHGSVLQL
jgi:hypothetical protein